MHLVPLLRWPLLATLAFLAGPVPVRAEEPAPGPPPPRSVEESRARATAAVADRLVEWGNWCAGRSYRLLAREQFTAATRLVPDHAAARERLGHKRAGDGWEAPSRRVSVKDAPVRPGGGVSALVKEHRAAYGDMAAAWAVHAKWCDESGYADDARAAWWAVLSYDPARPEARFALGLPEAPPGWLRPRDAGPDAWQIRARGLAASRRSAWSAPPASTYEAAVQGRYSVRARDLLDLDGARTILESMVVTEGVLADLGLPPAAPGKARGFGVTAVREEESYRWLVDSKPGADEREREALAALGGFWWDDNNFVDQSSSTARAADSAAHHLAERLLEDAFPDAVTPAWMEEGAAYLATTVVRGTACSWCVSFKGSGTEKELPAENADWNAVCRTHIENGDEPLLESLLATDVNGLTVPGLVKARSFLAWLLSGSPSTLEGLARAYPKGRFDRAAAERALGAPLETVDREWRLWARRP